MSFLVNCLVYIVVLVSDKLFVFSLKCYFLVYCGEYSYLGSWNLIIN